MNELIKYDTEHGEVKLSSEIIRQYLVPSGTEVSDQEVYLFLELCKAQKLNPFLREVYLVKYGSAPASMVTGKEVFTKRAMKHPMFAGLEAGITIIDASGNMIRREGSLSLTGERLMGGWAKVYLKGYTVPMFDEVALQEYMGKRYDKDTKSYVPTKMWLEKPATMIRKVAIVHALREAFPESFEGLYSQEEINTIDSSSLPTAPITVYNTVEQHTAHTPVQNVSTPVQQPVAPSKPVQTAPTAPTVARPASGTVDYGSMPLNFGSKHKGKTIREVAQDEASYLDWVVDKSNASDITKNNIKGYIASMKLAPKQATPVAKDITPADDDSGYVPPSDTDLPFDI